MKAQSNSETRVYTLLAILSLGSAGVYLITSWLTYRIGFPLDDAWIHQTYARNLAVYGEWAFTRGHPSAGSTSPLWTLLLAIGHLIGWAPYLWTYLMGWLALWGIALTGTWIYPWIRPESDKNMGWLVGALLVLEWHLVWAAVSGMETALFSLIVLIAFAMLNAHRQNWLVLGGIIGLSIWVRPDGLTLLGPAILVCSMQTSPYRQRASQIARLLVGFTLLFCPYLFWNRALSGVMWPNTFYAKQAEYAVELLEPLWKRLFEQAVTPNIGVGFLLIPGFIYSAFRALRDKKWAVLAGSLWVVGYLVVYALRLPVTYQHGRYVMPMMPVYFLWGLAGTTNLFHWSSSILWRRVLGKAWLVSIGLVCVVFWYQGARAYGRDVAFIESEMVETSLWVHENTEPDALVAAHDIGALGYFGGRRLLDMAGLVSPEVIPFLRDEAQLEKWLTQENADFLVTFPSWYPELTKALEGVFRTEGAYSQAFDGESMVVYRWGLRLR